MLQRLRQRRLFDIGGIPGAERPAGGRDDDADEFLTIARAQRLEQRVVLGIGRQDAGAGLLRALHEEIAGANQAFLVGQRDRRAAIDGGERGLQARCAADGGHHPVGRTRGGLDDRAFARTEFGARARERLFQFGQAARIGHRDKARIELLCELGEPLNIAVAGQRLDPVAIRRGAQQVHGAVADRAGGAENGHTAHGRRRGLVVTQRDCAHASPNHKSSADAIHAAAQISENRREHDCRDKAVQAVHYPAMAGNYVT